MTSEKDTIATLSPLQAMDPENDVQIQNDEIFTDTDDQVGISFARTKKVAIQVRNLAVGSRIVNSGKLSFFSKMVPHGRGHHQEDIETNSTIKPILHSMSFDIPQGSLSCIIGGSGSGKTTLLNFLAQRRINSSTLSSTGEVMYNNESDLSHIRHAYVIQQDILIPTLTCYETLMYAAELKLPKLTSKEERSRLVHELILQLGLKECADTIVGGMGGRKGMSGGERRRLSVAIQLVSNPSLLFLDEPTTGLDSYNAYLLCLTLKRIAQKFHKTIITSIHQPRADIFKLFDKVLILSNGRLCYGDTYDRIFPYFSQIGYPLPEHKVNPADFLIDITTVDTRTYDQERLTAARVEKISELWKAQMELIGPIKSIDNDPSSQDDVIFQRIGRAPFLREVGIHFRRNIKLQIRDPLGTISVLLEALLLGLVTGWMFFKPGTSTSGIRSLESSLYMSSTLMCYLFSLYECYRLCQMDLRVFDRERMEGCVSIPGFLIGRRLSKFFTEDIFIPLLFSLPAYFMIGLRTDSAKYFWKFFAAEFIFNLNTMAVGMAASALSRDVSIATLICNLNFTFQTMTNGMFVNAAQMPVYVRWCKYAAYQWYSFGFLISNQFTDFYGDCFKENAGNPQASELCYASSGNYIIKQMGFWPHWDALPICVVLAFFLVTYMVAGIVLFLKPVDITMGKEVKTKEVISNKTHKEQEYGLKDAYKSEAHSPSHEQIDIKIRGIYLAVKPKFKKLQKDILKGIDCDFKASKLNIIMGPSGSGKTSLLNLISGRLSSNLAASYSMAGKMFFNECEVDDFSVIKPLCSYVIQEDDHLLSSLTVRETLDYAAKLRLSKRHLTKSQRRELVDGIILEMELRDCANTLVGNDLIKGISGGEKRRLSIAIQLLSSPKILFLDEPTSGLDAFTASSILECLEKLAKKGTTVIITIHQPRTLDRFGTVLLLAKGGKVAFDGTQDEMIEHFTRIGFPFPKFTNIGDYVIDLISYNTASEAVEYRTRARVDRILNEWERVAPLHLIDAKCAVTVKTKEELRTRFKSYVKEPASFLLGFVVLTKRQWTGLIRDTNTLISRSCQTIGMGIILSLFFARLKYDILSIQNRFGVVQQMVSLYFSGMLNNMAGYPKERDYFYEEYSDDVVRVPSFFMAYLLIELPFEIFPCFIFAVLMVFVVGMQYEVGLFFCIFYTVTIVVNAGESLGISFNTIIGHPGFSLTIISIFCSIAVCMSGLMAMNLGSFLRAMNYLSPPHYCVMMVANLIFTKSLKFHCLPDQMSSNGVCQFSTGLDVLKQYNLKVNMTLYWILISVMAVIHRAISFLFLELRLTKFRISKKFGHKAKDV